MAKIIPYIRFKALLADGSPAVGYVLKAFLAGTSTPVALFTSQDQSATHPIGGVVLDGNGEAQIWGAPNIAYKLELRTDADVVVPGWPIDNFNVAEAGYFTALSATGAATLGSLTVSGATVLAALSMSGQLTSTVAIGTPPLIVASTTKVTNLNVDSLDGSDWTTLPTLLQGQENNAVKIKSGGRSVNPSPGLDVTIEAGDALGSDAGGNVIEKPTAGSTAVNHGGVVLQAPNNSQWTRGYTIEEITLNTGGTTTDSAADLLPANSIIEAVVARVTVTIATATDWKLGDSAQAARFTAAQTGLTAGTTVVGLNHADPTVATANLGPVQSAAAKLRITTTGTPSAGKIRVIVFYRTFVPPTS